MVSSVGNQRQRARSILFWRERCNNSTKVVTSVLDIVVYEDDRMLCEIDKCNAHTGEIIEYIWVVCREKGSKGVNWTDDEITAADEFWNGGDEGEILAVVIYV